MERETSLFRRGLTEVAKKKESDGLIKRIWDNSKEFISIKPKKKEIVKE